MIMSLVLCCAIANAQVELPLGGNYRPGRLMPIIFTPPPGAGITLRAEGMIPTQIRPGTRVAHVLLLGATNILHIDGLTGGPVELPLHAMEENERLIGTVGGSERAPLLQPLFPGQPIISVRLDSLEGNLDSLDAVVIDPDRSNAELALTKGLLVAIRAEKPDWDAPLRRSGDFWVIRPSICGPRDAIGGEDAYLPALAWSHGWDAGMRRRIVLAGVLVCLAALASLLVRRPRRQIVAIITVAAICTASIELWRRSSLAVQTAAGAIRVIDQQGIVQTDAWEYFWGGRSGAQITFRDRRPILFDRAHAESIGLKLTCDSQGEEWSATLPANATLATLRRAFSLQPRIGGPASEIPSPMRELARRAYLRPGLEIKGEEKAHEDWPTVIIAPEP